MKYYKENCSQSSEEFIENHKNKINWYYASRNQKLSEKFIEKHSDELHWGWISNYQKMSEEFIIEHFDKIGLFPLLQNKNVKLTKKFIKKIVFLKEI